MLEIFGDVANQNAVIITAISLLGFFYFGVRARRPITSDNEFFLASRQIGSGGLSRTIPAASISISSGLFIYFLLFPIYGAWILIGVLSFIIGLTIFYFIFRLSSADINSFTTIGEFARNKIGSSRIGVFADFINVLSFFAILVAEMIIGIGLIKFLIPNFPYADIVSFFLIGSIIFGYIVINGFRGVVSSDIWQFRLIIVSSISFLLTAYLLYSNSDAKSIEMSGSAGVEGTILYIVFAALLNLTLPISQLASWQRVAATRPQDRRKGYIRGVIYSAILWILFWVIAALISGAGITVGSSTDWGSIFEPAKALGVIPAELLFPLMVAGLFAAMISTADSALIASAFAFYSAFRRIKPSNRGDSDSTKGSRWIVLFVFLLIVFVLYQLFTNLTKGNQAAFISLIFYLLSQLVVIAPLTVSLCVGRSKLKSERLIFYSLITGWMLLTGGALYDMIIQTTAFTFAGALLGVLIAAIGVAVGLKRDVSGLESGRA